MEQQTEKRYGGEVIRALDRLTPIWFSLVSVIRFYRKNVNKYTFFEIIIALMLPVGYYHE